MSQEALADYIRIMRRHIMKEETVLFPIARKNLDDVDWDEINSVFAKNDDPMFGAKE